MSGTGLSGAGLGTPGGELSAMVGTLARNWWALALRGVLAIIFGVLAFVWPGQTIEVLVLLFGAYALVDGVFAIVQAVRAAGQHARWWPFLLEGIAGILAGLIALVAPGFVAVVATVFIGAWAIVTGIVEIVAAIRLRNAIEGEWRLILSGVLSLIFGLLLFIFPIAGAFSLVWLIGTYAILFGIILLLLAFRLRSHATTAP